MVEARQHGSANIVNWLCDESAVARQLALREIYKDLFQSISHEASNGYPPIGICMNMASLPTSIWCFRCAIQGTSP